MDSEQVEGGSLQDGVGGSEEVQHLVRGVLRGVVGVTVVHQHEEVQGEHY